MSILKEKFNAKYAVRADDGVQTENVLLDQSKVIKFEDEGEE